MTRQWLMTLVVAVMGCAAASAERGFALYPGPRAAADQVATIEGPIATIDGQDVAAHGSSFELRAGCHVVTTKTDFVEHDVRINIGGIMSHHPSQTFVLSMQPQFGYLIHNRSQELDGFSGRPWLVARETDRGGAMRYLEPTTDAGAIAGCQPR